MLKGKKSKKTNKQTKNRVDVVAQVPFQQETTKSLIQIWRLWLQTGSHWMAFNVPASFHLLMGRADISPSLSSAVLVRSFIWHESLNHWKSNPLVPYEFTPKFMCTHWDCKTKNVSPNLRTAVWFDVPSCPTIKRNYLFLCQELRTLLIMHTAYTATPRGAWGE